MKKQGRPPNYKELYKLSLILMKEHNIDLTMFNASEYANRIGCNKSNVYNHIKRINTDILCI